MDTQDNNMNMGGEKPMGSNMPPKQTPQKNMPMAVLAYLGPLVIVSYVMAKDDPFVKFHIKQGLTLLAAEVIVWVLSMFMWPLWMLLNLVNLIIFVLSIVGIINAVNGQEKELPFVGQFGKNFNI